jgi:hypothetical protein
VFSLAGMDRSGASSLSLVELLVQVGEKKNGGGGEGVQQEVAGEQTLGGWDGSSNCGSERIIYSD